MGATLLLAAGYALKWADAQVLAVVLPLIKREFGASDASLGLLAGLPFAIFYATLGVPLARLADRGRRRDLTAGATLVFSVATALSAAAGSFAALFATRIAVGVGEAGATPPAQSLIADLVPRRRLGFALSVYGGGLPVGVLLGYAVGGVVAAAHGWRAACVAVAAPGFLLALLIRVLVPEPPARGAPSAPVRLGAALADLAGNRAYRALLAATTLASLTGLAALAWLPSFLARAHGMDARASGLFLGLMTGGVGLAGALLSGLAADRVVGGGARGRAVFLSGGSLAGLPPLLLFYLLPGGLHPLLFVLPAALGATYAGIAPAIVAELVAPDRRATALAVLLLVVNVAATLAGPVLVGIASDRTGLRAALALSTGALLPAALLYGRVARLARPVAIRHTGAAPAPPIPAPPP